MGNLAGCLESLSFRHRVGILQNGARQADKQTHNKPIPNGHIPRGLEIVEDQWFYGRNGTFCGVFDRRKPYEEVCFFLKCCFVKCEVLFECVCVLQHFLSVCCCFQLIFSCWLVGVHFVFKHCLLVLLTVVTAFYSFLLSLLFKPCLQFFRCSL